MRILVELPWLSAQSVSDNQPRRLVHDLPA